MDTSVKLAVLTSLLLLNLTACSPKSTNEVLLDAEQLKQEGKYQEASIALKNIIKEDPNNFTARESLGLIYLEQGLYSAARKELVRADTALSPNGVVSLAETYLWLESFDELQKLSIPNTDENTESFLELAIYKAIATYNSGGKFRAAASFSRLTESDSLKVSQLAKAYLAIQNNRIGDAIDYTNKSVEAQPDFIAALQLKAILEAVEGKWSLAIQTLEGLLEKRAHDYKIKLKLADALVNNKEYDKAEPFVNQLLSLSANHPYFNQLKGTIEFSKNDFESALIYLDTAIKNGRSNSVTRLLAALANYYENNLEQAYQNLKVIVETLPPEHFSHKLYSIVQVQLGYSNDNDESLEDIATIPVGEALYLAKSSSLLIQEGEIAQAKSLIEQISTDDVQDAELLRSIGLLKILTADTGIEELEKSFQQDPDSEKSFLVLAFAYLNAEQFDKAEQLAVNWLKAHPDTVSALHIQAQASSHTSNANKVAGIYSKILGLEPEHVSANLFFVEKDVRNNDLASAKAKIESLVNYHPLDMVVLIRHFQIQKELEYYSVAIEPFKKAYNSSDDIKYALLYAGALAELNKTDEQLSVLKNIHSKAENEPKYWMMLADAYWERKDFVNAAQALEKWRRLEQSTKAFLKSIELAEITRDYKGALELVEEGISLFPDQTQLKLIKARILILDGDIEQATTVFDSLSPAIKSSTLGLTVQSKLLIAKRKYSEAVNAIEKVYQNVKSQEVASILYTALFRANKEAEALAFTEKHLSIAPSHNKIRLLAANQQMYSAPNKSIAHYKYLVENEAVQSPLVLNNLAWLLGEAQKYDDALVYANRAQAILPENPSIMATRGKILLQLDRIDESLDLLENAFKTSANSPDIGIDYVVALLKAKDKSEAQKVLTQLKPKTQEHERRIDELKVQANL
ncbi:XrtA/PEP-CTERM system TPR-repeat protein PrsT [Alteromonas stellipolaris]|uniref:XrtA/PEP-CTERM system TPR-repeat protein PrsT n=1 Tax=Alteromonas stellipolaris TaxID=233316 RepID=UPI001D35B5B0|nr:XrtA/PEP-CTERM system TPR-repeat protein PrsT [Alteromonas stellipolaris]MBZ2161883.1 PEP-CTERM system TPR-repeat protein PrsT [Alteromonas stellipolaris]